MNYLVLTSGVLALLATIGHFVIGSKDFLKPVLDSNIDEIPKKVMQSLFHYMSVYMIFTSIVLIAVAIGQNLLFKDPEGAVKFIGITYAGFAVTQFIIAATSTIKMGVLKLFQWTFWMLIAIFSLLG